MRTWLLAAALGSAAVSGIASAAQDMPPPPGAPQANRMMRGDSNGDGVLSRDEATAEADARFARMDANGDGVVTPDERPMHGPRGLAGDAPPPPPGGAAPPPPGAEGRTLTREQYRAMALRRFDRMDANHDGKVDRSEVAAAIDRTRQYRGQGGDNGPPPPAGPPPAGE